MNSRKSRFLPALFAVVAGMICLISQFSCRGKTYNEFKAYPVPERLSVAAGDTSFIALRVEIPESYYIYGNPKGPGIGKPTIVTVKAPEGIVFSEARYTTPEMHVDNEYGNTWIYRNETTIFLPFTVNEKMPQSQVTVTASLDALMCSNSECIPKRVTIPCSVDILIAGKKSTAHPDGLKKQFAESAPLHESSAGNQPDIEAAGDSQSFSAVSFEPRTLDAGISGLVQAVLFGLIAGIILNFMPCVLPVVSLKIMGFVQHAGKSKKELRLLGLLFSLGILVSFAFLAILAAFLGYSWGGLFQHRLFIVIMAAVVFALALSMFDVYTLNMPSFIGKAAVQRENPYTDAFVKGLLATLLATPCSGPFLGGTLAWALTQKPAVIVLIFMSVGTGMALPYLLLTMNRKLISFIPKPGRWMQTFERIMGFLLIFTVIYLVGILDRDSIMPAVAFLGFVALGLWQFGQFGAIHQKRTTRIASLVLLLVIVGGGYDFSFNSLYPKAQVRNEESAAFSPERILRNRDQGKISMVVFTADWCPNCRLVEKLSLHTPKVLEEIQKLGVDLVTADITRANPPATELLHKIGGRSIPYLAVFPAGADFTRPICLRDIYSEGDVVNALRMAVEPVKLSH